MAYRDPRFNEDELKKPWEDPDYDPDDDPRKLRPEDLLPSPIAKTKRFIPYGGFGQGRPEPTSGIDPLQVASDLVERDPSGWVKFRDFTRGIITIVKRGLQPRGSLADSKNFVPNTLIGALQQRKGYSSYITIPLNDVDGNAVFANATEVFPLSTEFPESKDIDVVSGWAQKPYWQSSNTSTSAWRLWGENDTLTVSAIAGDLTTITFSGGSPTNDYYNNCRLYNSTRNESVFIQDYVGGTGVATPNEKIPSDWLTGDSYILYRDFHDNPTPFQSFSGSTIEPHAINQGNSILACGGRHAQEDGKFLLSMFLDTTYFAGTAKTPRVWGTYVTEAEIKSTVGVSFANASAFTTTAGEGLDVNDRWFIAFLYRTVDNQLSTLIKPATNYISPVTNNGIRTTCTIDFPLMNKRIRFIEVFIGRAPVDANPVELDWSDYWHVDTLDLTESGWTYTESTTTPGQYSKILSYDATDWVNSNETQNVVDWTGTTQYNRSTVSAAYFLFHKGRLFASKAYDFYSGQNLDDEILWSAYSGVLGTPQYNVLPDTAGHSQSSVESGDPASIKGLGRFQDELIVLKDNSSYRVDVSDPDPINWRLSLMAKIGCDLPRSIILTPYGLIWVKTEDDIYWYRGGSPVSLTQDTIQPTFRTRTNGLTTAQKQNLFGWYNEKRKAYEIMLSNSNKKEYWSTFFELPIGSNFAWFRQETAHDIEWVKTGRTGGVIITSSGQPRQFTETNVDDAGTSIKTFWDTGEQVLDERNITLLDRIYITKDQDASATVANNLDIQVTVDGAEFTLDGVSSYTNAVTKTANRFERGLPIGCRGRTFRVRWNTNGTPATWTASSGTATPLTIFELGIKTMIQDSTGDISQSV